jgi:hypothetical protein
MIKVSHYVFKSSALALFISFDDAPNGCYLLSSLSSIKRCKCWKAIGADCWLLTTFSSALSGGAFITFYHYLLDPANRTSI